MRLLPRWSSVRLRRALLNLRSIFFSFGEVWFPLAAIVLVGRFPLVVFFGCLS
jgi:hypothetical protein